MTSGQARPVPPDCKLTDLGASPKETSMQVRMLLALACVLAIACGGGESGSGRSARPVTPLDPATTGTIDVDVGFQGTVPPMRELRIGGVQGCADHSAPVPVG